MIHPLNNYQPTHPKEAQAFAKLQLLITALNHHTLPDEVTGTVNAIVDQANHSPNQGSKRARELQATWRQVVETVKKGTGLVPRKYHFHQWMALGMAVFGMSIGVSFSLALNNFAFIGLGLPIGMAIGMAVGADMDKKAAATGKQLDAE